MNREKLFTELSKEGLQIGVLLLGDEFKFLNEEGSWLTEFPVPVHIARLTLQEFRELDIGKHPKLLIYKNGREVLNHDGMPEYEALHRIVRDML